MTKLRDIARGQNCTIRLPGCPNATETTVLAHLRLAGLCGMGLKPIDAIGAWADCYCHDRVDGRVKCDLTKEELRLAHAEGVMRTLNELHKLGIVLK